MARPQIAGRVDRGGGWGIRNRKQRVSLHGEIRALSGIGSDTEKISDHCIRCSRPSSWLAEQIIPIKFGAGVRQPRFVSAYFRGRPGDHRVKRDNASSHLRPLKSLLPDRDCRSTRLHSPQLARLDIFTPFLLDLRRNPWNLSFPPFKLDSAEVILCCISTLNQPPCSASSVELFLSPEQIPAAALPISLSLRLQDFTFLARIGSNLYFPQHRRAFSQIRS